MDETTITEQATETTASGESTTTGIDLSKLDQATNKDDTETVEGLKAILEKEKLARVKVEADARKFKESFDKKAREKAEAEKKAKAAEAKANEPVEEVARLQRELEELKTSNMKSNLTYTLSKEWGVTDELTAKMVSSIFSDDTGGFVEDAFREAQLELINSIREQAKKEGYEQRDKEIMNGKPRSMGQSKASSPFDDVVNDLVGKHGSF